MNTLFLVCASLGGVVVLAQLGLSMFGVGDHDAGHDAGHDALHDNGHGAPSEGLQMFSVRAISGGVAFFGIGGLGANALGWPAALALVVGAVFGAAAMVGVAATMRAMLRLQRDGSVRIERAVGEQATVYVPVPAALAGVGKITMTLQGRIVEYQAVTPDAHPLPTGSPVLVVNVRDHDTVEVIPYLPVDGVS